MCTNPEKYLAALRPSARPLWLEGTAPHPFSLLVARIGLPASVLAPFCCRTATMRRGCARTAPGAGERSGASSVVGRIGRVGHSDSYDAPVRRVVPCPPAVVTLLGGPRRPPVTGKCPPPAERSGGCREPAVEVAVCGRAGWHGAGRRQETCEDKFPAAGRDATSSKHGDDVTRPSSSFLPFYPLSGTNLWQCT